MTHGPLLQLIPRYQMLEGGPVAIVMSRLSDGLIVQANDAYFRVTGYTREETLGASATSLRLWADTKARAQMVAAMKSAGYQYNLAIDLRRKSGEIIEVLCSAHIMSDPGEPHILTIINDLRDMDGSVSGLVREREHLDFVEVAGQTGFWNLDSVSGQLSWSYGMELLYGLPKGGFKGTVEDFVQRIHPDDVARNLRERQQAIDSRQPFDIKFRIVRTDGAVRWVISRGAARFNASGALVGASGLQVDITEQVEREQQMRLQTQVMKNMAEGVLMVSADTAAIVYANPRFEQMLGYAGGQLVGLPVSAINASSEHDPVALANTIVQALHVHGEWRGELKNRCADGREIWTRCTVSTMLYEGMGRVWVAVHSDITEQRLAQHARDNAFAQLRRLSLNIQDSIEAERLAVSREVHDQLGAALTGMRMKLESLAASLGAEGQELAADLLAVADTARTTQIAARDICTRLRPQVLDDMGLVETCRWYLGDWSQQVGIATRSHFARLRAEPDGHVATDMFRVLQELLTNVARHAGATRVRVSLSGGPQGLTLRVDDNGHGFAPAHSPHGFGLMGVRERVRHHAGSLQLDSGPTGTRVTVTMQNRTVA
jgi:PAS domain S-box-containing protein